MNENIRVRFAPSPTGPLHIGGLRTALFQEVSESKAAAYLSDYATAFPGGYREDCHPRIAVKDIQRIERARADARLVLHLYHPIAESPEEVHVRLYSLAQPASLSQVIPILEHMGLSVFGERPYRTAVRTDLVTQIVLFGHYRVY